MRFLLYIRLCLEMPTKHYIVCISCMSMFPAVSYFADHFSYDTDFLNPGTVGGNCELNSAISVESLQMDEHGNDHRYSLGSW